MHKYYESRKIARENWRKTEHGKKWTQNYMKEYRSRPKVKVKYHEYYVKNKEHWGEITKAKQRKKYSFAYNAIPKNKLKRHEWYVQKKIKDNENDNLHAINAERFTNV